MCLRHFSENDLQTIKEMQFIHTFLKTKLLKSIDFYSTPKFNEVNYTPDQVDLEV